MSTSATEYGQKNIDDLAVGDVFFAVTAGAGYRGLTFQATAYEVVIGTNGDLSYKPVDLDKGLALARNPETGKVSLAETRPTPSFSFKQNVNPLIHMKDDPEFRAAGGGNQVHIPSIDEVYGTEGGAYTRYATPFKAIKLSDEDITIIQIPHHMIDPDTGQLNSSELDFAQISDVWVKQNPESAAALVNDVLKKIADYANQVLNEGLLNHNGHGYYPTFTAYDKMLAFADKHDLDLMVGQELDPIARIQPGIEYSQSQEAYDRSDWMDKGGLSQEELLDKMFSKFSYVNRDGQSYQAKLESKRINDLNENDTNRVTARETLENNIRGFGDPDTPQNVNAQYDIETIQNLAQSINDGDYASLSDSNLLERTFAIALHLSIEDPDILDKKTLNEIAQSEEFQSINKSITESENGAIVDGPSKTNLDALRKYNEDMRDDPDFKQLGLAHTAPGVPFNM